MTQIPVSRLPHDKHHVKLIPLGDDMVYDFRRPHRHDYFEFFIFEKGGGVHFIDFTEYPITAGSVHVIFPNQVHLLRRTQARGQIIICRTDFIDLLPKTFYNELHQHYFATPCISLPEAAFRIISGVVALLEEELKQEHIFAQELVKNYISAFLIECIRQAIQRTDAALSTPQYPPHQLELYHKFTHLLEQHFRDKQNVDFYASALSVTPKVLNNCVRKITGKTCIDILQERTLTEAKRRLLYADEHIKEIAFDLNFKDVSYFSRFFTRLEGKSPKAFKSYWEEKYHY